MRKTIGILAAIGLALFSQAAWAQKETQAIKRLPAAYLQLACGTNCGMLPQRTPAAETYHPRVFAMRLKAVPGAEAKQVTLPVHDHIGGQTEIHTVGIAFDF